MWLYPFGIPQISPNDNKLKYYAKLGVEALEKSTENSPEWKYGQTIELMYKAGGTSIDWAHKDVGIDLAYTTEMRDSGEYGFLLPEDEIYPAAKEVWTGTKALLEAYAEDSKNAINYETTTINTTSDQSIYKLRFDSLK